MISQSEQSSLVFRELMSFAGLNRFINSDRLNGNMVLLGASKLSRYFKLETTVRLTLN